MTFRRVALAAACVLLAIASVSATAPNTPADGSSTFDPMCQLESLQLSGLTIYAVVGGGGFNSNKYHYACSCDASFTSTVVTPRMIDSGSSAEITFNGEAKHFRSTGNAISNTGNALTNGVKKSPLTQSSPLEFRVGLNTIKIGVGCNGLADPDCYYEYIIECTKPPADGGLITGDPQFVGLRGQEYQVHGVAGEVYNIVSDKDLQYNARFVFLHSGECPVVNGKKQKACYSHPGSYLGELGLKTRAGDKIHLVSGAAKLGFESVTVNGKELAVGESVLLAEEMGSVSRNSTHLASVTVGNWDFAFESSDMFVNQRVRVLDARSLRSHGLLGQTWRQVTYPNAVKHIQGEVDDYVVQEADVFGDSFVFNSFN